jgi:putative transposase
MCIPKYRKQKIFRQGRKYVGSVFHEVARHQESTIIEEHMMPDHVHMCLAIPPKSTVAQF